MNGRAVIVDDCCRARTHIRDGHRDDGVDRMSAVLRGKFAPIRRMVEVQERKVVLLKRFAHSSYRIKAIAPPGRPAFIKIRKPAPSLRTHPFRSSC